MWANPEAKGVDHLKRIITMLLAAVLALGLVGCAFQKPQEPEPEDLGTIDVIGLIRNVEAISFPVDYEFADRRITRFQLSQALQAAAEKKLSAADGEAAGLALGQEGYWSRTYHLEGSSEGVSAGDLWMELSCGLTENLVRITAYKGSQYGLCYVDAPELYELLRHYRDRETTISEQAKERYSDVLSQAIQAVYQDAVDNGQPFTGWELTRLEYLHSYTDETDDSTVNIYAVEYVMLTDHPEKVQWKDGMALDSQARVENVGDIGRLATRYWWWGEKWESAVLPRNVAADELKEAREALNANNPRD